MSAVCQTKERTVHGLRSRLRRAGISRRRRMAFLILINLAVLATCFLLAEVGFRLFWTPKYWVHTDRWKIGSGQTEAGKKWWPDTTYSVDSSEFRVEFRTNASGYRARPAPVRMSHPYRVAFVGDSFTEGMQVPYESTFCARLERLLNQSSPARPLVCENDGVSATDLLDYWHRIVHDVLAGDPPDALVLCIYPGNDFQCAFPDDAFDPEDRSLRDYFKKPSWTQHLIAWVNLHSAFRLLPATRALEHRHPSESPAQPGTEELVDRPRGCGPRSRLAGRAPVPGAVGRDRRRMPAPGDQAVHPRRGAGRQLCGEERGEPAHADLGELGSRYSRHRCCDQGSSPARSSIAHLPDGRPSQRGRSRLYRPGSGPLPPRLPVRNGADRSALEQPAVKLLADWSSEGVERLSSPKCRARPRLPSGPRTSHLNVIGYADIRLHATYACRHPFQVAGASYRR